MPDRDEVLGTACYRTVGVDPERMFFASATDPVQQRGMMQSRFKVQLRFSVIYDGVPTYALSDKFSDLFQSDGSYVVRDDLLEHLGTLHTVRFDGWTKKPRRKGSRRGGRSRVHSGLVDDLPDACGVVACSRLLGVNYRTVRYWVARHGLPVERQGRRAIIARETLRTWLRQTYRLVGPS